MRSPVFILVSWSFSVIKLAALSPVVSVDDNWPGAAHVRPMARPATCWSNPTPIYATCSCSIACACPRASAAACARTRRVPPSRPAGRRAASRAAAWASDASRRRLPHPARHLCISGHLRAAAGQRRPPHARAAAWDDDDAASLSASRPPARCALVTSTQRLMAGRTRSWLGSRPA